MIFASARVARNIKIVVLKSNNMKTIDTRDLKEKREELQQQILDDFNEKFETEFDDFDEITLERLDIDDFEEMGRDTIEEFTDYWKPEYRMIEEIDGIESEVGNEFDYGCTLIPESDFTKYCEDLVQDVGDLPKGIPSYIRNNIDWDGVAEDLKVDYSELQYEGETYLYRA